MIYSEVSGGPVIFQLQCEIMVEKGFNTSVCRTHYNVIMSRDYKIRPISVQFYGDLIA